MSAYATALMESPKEEVVTEALVWYDRAREAETRITSLESSLTAKDAEIARLQILYERENHYSASLLGEIQKWKDSGVRAVATARENATREFAKYLRNRGSDCTEGDVDNFLDLRK